jgi:hypothetical protein
MVSHRRAEGDLVGEADIDADHGDRAAGAAAHDGLTQDVRAVGGQHHRRLRLVEHRVGADSRIGLGADRVDAAVGAAAFGHLHQPVVDVFLVEVDDLDAAAIFLGEGDALRHLLDQDHPPRAEHPRALHRELSHQAAAPDHHRVALLDLGDVRGEVAGREDVG